MLIILICVFLWLQTFFLLQLFAELYEDYLIGVTCPFVGKSVQCTITDFDICIYINGL